jgi:L-ascorbate metabolism protein UlaG (beta-lactamase superfamily)
MGIELNRARRRDRRSVLAGAGIVGTAALLYSAFPVFWRGYFNDLRRPILPAPLRPDPARWPDTGLHAAWIGHSTVLLKIDGFTVITDPIFSDRAGVALGPLTLGVKRLVSAALQPPDVPKADLILLSHAHMDHLDIPSLRMLENRRITVITASRTADLLSPDRYAAVHEMGWGDQLKVGPLKIKAVEVRHWGARFRGDTYRGYNGYVVESRHYRILFAGDTGLTDSFRQARSRRAIDLAIMPIGCYNPYRRNHCSPGEALQMSEDALADRVLPVHHQTFQLSREPISEPLALLLDAVRGRPERIAIQQIGQEFHL